MQPRHDEERHGIVRQRLQRVDLLGDAHRPDLRRHARADAPREHQTGEQRPELEHLHEPNGQPDDRELHTRKELIPHLDRDDAADEGGDDDRERDRLHAHALHLPDRLRDERRGIAERAPHVAQEVPARPDRVEEREEGAGDAAEDFDAGALDDGERLRRLQPAVEGPIEITHVRTRARSTSPTTANIAFGSQAATSGVMMALPPIAFVSWIIRRKMIVVARLTPMP